MKSLFTAIGLALSSTLTMAAGAEATATYVGNADQGKDKSATCAACHGADGNSAAADYPKLAGQHPTYLASTLKAYRDGSRVNAIMAGMAAALSDDDIADLAAYYTTQATSGGAVDADLVARGEQLFRFGDSAKGVSACTACHGPTGAGVASAGFPSLKGQWAGYTETQLKAYREGSRANAMMNGVAQNLSDADIRAVASYVGGLQ
ncbi:cytochrome c4 [Litoricolaceae bacterium]|nr:cytochrome c4 [Litorivicinaceae bacterium]